jgi:hypothetical protein
MKMYHDSPKFDERDAELLRVLQDKWDAKAGPRVGDFVQMLDGTLRRFTHNWGDSLQTTVGGNHPCSGDASFFFGAGYMSFSGSLDRAIPRASLENTWETRIGRAWFFHHNEARAHNGVYFDVTCRVFRQLAGQ